MNKKVIIFDADGVVIRSEMFSIQYQKKFNVSPEQMLPFFNGIFQDCLIGKKNLKEVVKPYLKKWNWKGSVDEFLQYWFKSEHKIDQKVSNLIKVLRKNHILCYLATNQEKHRTQYMRKEMGFGKFFDGIFSSAEIGSKKPNRKFYQYIIQALWKKGITKSEIIYVDNTLSFIESAKSLGIDTSYLYSDFTSFDRFMRINHFSH